MTSHEARLTIKSIELINFMCHRHLLIEFKKTLTCIGGRNGSGKSAVMVAMGIVLGQRASALDRGNTYKELIKSNEHTAIVRLSINNYLAFQEPFFGDTIFVEKTLHLNFSKLRIYSSDNKTWSKKKQDLDDIIDLYSLYFDNPLNFLTQDMSKRFLNLSKPQTLYSFFLKGTEIENMEELHNEAYDQVARMQTKIEHIEEELDTINEELCEKNEKLGYLDEASNFRETLKSLESERMWSEVLDIRKKAEWLDEDMAKVEEETKARKAEAHECEKNIRALESEVDALRQEYLAEKTENESARRAFEAKIGELELRDREISNDLRNIEEQLLTKTTSLADASKAHAKKDVRAEMHTKLQSLETQVNALKDERDKGLAAEERVREKVRAEAKDLDDANAKMFALKKQIAFLNNVKTNNLTFFSEKMPEILNEIARAGMHAIGPLGALIKLKEPKWYKPVSIILRNVLSNFIVKSTADRERLSAIFKKHGVNFRILLPSTQNKIIEYKSNKIFRTVLDVLEIRDEIVTNQVIILQSIEQIVLVENREEAHSIIRKKPSFVTMAYTVSGDRVSMIGSSLSDFRQRHTGKYYFENDDSKLRSYQDELHALGMREARSSKQELVEMEARSYQTGREINRLERETKQIEFELESHARFVETASSSDVENEIKILKNQRVGLTRAREECRRETEEMKSRLGSFRTTGLDLTKKEAAIGALRAKKYATEASFENAKAKVHEKAKERNRLLEIFEKEREKLVLRSAEPSDARPLSVIDRETGVLKGKIAALQDMGNVAELRAAVEGLKRQRRFKDDLVQRHKKKTQNFVEFVKKRVEKREEMKIEIAQKASEEFGTLTQYRGYVGKLLFDHDEKSLDIRMAVEHVEAGSKGTLSGGERSFAGVCFLLSLWPNVGCPVKVLDEFDVFMDNLNRKLTIKIVLSFLARNACQVILITPLNTKDLFTDICDVIVLEKPRSD